jgi:UPF0271 protein
MQDAARAALDAGLAVGAHPGYPDPARFGRHELGLTPAEIRDLVLEQAARLAEVLARAGGRLRHVKLHGALYHRADHDPRVAEAVVDAVRSLDVALAVIAPPAGALAVACGAREVPFLREAFADRAYAPDGRLVPRQVSGSVRSPDDAAAQAVRVARDGLVPTTGGVAIPVPADTLCVHGDTPGAIGYARRIRSALEQAGVEVTATGWRPRP